MCVFYFMLYFVLLGKQQQFLEIAFCLKEMQNNSSQAK